MPAPKGHPKWGNPLKPKKYTPKRLWDKAVEYFTYIDKHPYYLNEQKKGNTIVPKDSNLTAKQLKDALDPIIEIPKMRPYTLVGFCVFADICYDTFLSYEKNETYLEVCTRIRNIVESNMFEGGLVGNFEKGLVARKLGLIDKQDITTAGEKFETIDYSKLDETILRAIVEASNSKES